MLLNLFQSLRSWIVIKVVEAVVSATIRVDIAAAMSAVLGKSEELLTHVSQEAIS